VLPKILLGCPLFAIPSAGRGGGGGLTVHPRGCPSCLVSTHITAILQHEKDQGRDKKRLELRKIRSTGDHLALLHAQPTRLQARPETHVEGILGGEIEL